MFALWRPLLLPDRILSKIKVRIHFGRIEKDLEIGQKLDKNEKLDKNDPGLDIELDKRTLYKR